MVPTIKKNAISDLSITPRQQQILSLLMEGKSNKEIADELDIQLGTVKQHLFVLFRKLGVTNRAKAVLAAKQVMKAHRADTIAPANLSVQTNHALVGTNRNQNYVWRMVSVVAVFLPDSSVNSPQLIVDRDRYLVSLRSTISEATEALDGRFVSLPYGGMLAWFGHPAAHVDDADRAVQLAQQLQSWSDQYCIEHPMHEGDTQVLKPVGIGIASRPEVVAEQSTELSAAESFRVASILARHARNIGRPLADASTQKLAPLSVPWLSVKISSDSKPIDELRLTGVAALGARSLALPDVRARWMGMPFLEAIFQTVENGVAQWLSVESWPPVATTSLIDAIGNAAAMRKFKMLRLRSPANGRRDRLLASFSSQVEMAAIELGIDRPHLYAHSSSGERLAAMIADCTEVGNLVIQVYGFKALDAFSGVLGDRGIAILVSRRVLIVAANLRDTGHAQTTIRLLGPRPTNMPLSRIFSMQVPDFDVLPDDIRVDLQALMDSLSEPSRALITLAAVDPDRAIDDYVHHFDFAHHQIQTCLSELTSSGLVAPRAGGGFQFRDMATAQAINKLSVEFPVVGVMS